MAHVAPWRFWHAAPQLAGRVAAVPYDVVDRSEACALAENNLFSFLHVTRPDIDLSPDPPPSHEAICKQAVRAFNALLREGVLQHEDEPCYYVYALKQADHVQVGVVLAASVADYESHVVRKHEHTRPDKEQDRIRHLEALQAQTGKVFLVHRPHAGIAKVVHETTASRPLIDFEALDQVRHTLWRVAPQDTQRVTAGFKDVGPLYIADGHHRAAAAARVADAKRAQGHPDAAAERFLAVAFATDTVRILPYHRVVRGLGAHGVDNFLQALQQKFALRKGPSTSCAGQVRLCAKGTWYSFTLPAPKGRDTMARLDVARLQESILAPLLGVADPRQDKRMEFVGGVHGDQILHDLVSDGESVAFCMHPTVIEDMLSIADAGTVMPPKSTWFEPKLRDGLVLLRFDA